MGRETVTEYEVEQTEKEVEVLFCDHCGSRVGPVGEAKLVDIMVNPDIDATINIPSPASIEQTVRDAMEMTHMYEPESDLSFNTKQLHDRHQALEVNERRIRNEEYPYIITDEIIQELRPISGVNVDVTAEYTEEVCPSCARGEFGIDVPKELVNPEQKELLEDRVEELEGTNNADEMGMVIAQLIFSMMCVSFVGTFLLMGTGSESYHLAEYVLWPLGASAGIGLFALGSAVLRVLWNHIH